MSKKRFLLLSLLLAAVVPASAQSFKVDGQGVIRDTKTRQEGAWFGVNYTAPFAHAYRQLQRFGADIKQTIDKDTYHLARMGANAYRIHVWDYQITDAEGNLLSNEHLDLFDYLIARLEDRGINIVLTMIMGGNNFYPEPGEDLPGFSGSMSKAFATSDPGAAAIEENYIRNFLNHLNPYTGHRTKEDPMIVGFEVNNEPTNNTPPKETTAFVNRMIDAVRSTGCKKPVFYNVSHNFQNTQAFYDSKMDGGTFQWYPTGLVANFTRKGNFLPHVAEYKIPFDNIKGFDKKARIVYEFDAADQWAAYLYPAIVRSFRTAGFQWVTFFAYDPIDIAQINTEYQTHYLNLAYTPSKAISFKIAAEAMRTLPRGVSYGHYPENNHFGDFYVEYERDLSVMNTPQKYFYSNSNDILPKDAAALTAVAGVGSSPVVQYEGTGAYFLDKVSDGIWRLEVMPDQVLLSDPFAKASPHKEVNTILWNDWKMSVSLPDLGEAYSLRQIDGSGTRQGTADGTAVTVSPGTYLLARQGVSTRDIQPSQRLGNIRLGEFVAPAPRQKTLEVLHEPVAVASAGQELKVSARVIAPELPDSVILYSSALYERPAGGRQGQGRVATRPPTRRMVRTNGYTFEAAIPAGGVVAGNLDYYIITYQDGAATTFPGGVPGLPSDWDFYNGGKTWATEVAAQGQPVLLYGPDWFDKAEVFGVKIRNVRKSLAPAAYPGATRSTRIETARMMMRPGGAPADAQARPAEDGEAFLRLNVKDLVAGRKADLATCGKLCIKVEGCDGIPTIRAGFKTRDGFSYKADVPCHEGIIEIPVASLKLTSTIIRPETYPGFLPDYFIPDPALAPAFRLQDIESFEIGSAQVSSDAVWSLDLASCWLQ
ncbi:MAG: cellulase family glycosylhydrolase [Bacteroidales bacterium]|nr:cellulase family glycosylhydrolase [Bacteroidales bacterium]